MEKLALFFQKQGIKPVVIYASPLKRTIQSVEEILKIFPNMPVICETDLQEVDCGKFTGRKLSWVHSLDSFYALPTMESPEKIGHRMLTVMKKILKNYCGKTVFVVSHGDPIIFLLWLLTHPNSAINPVSLIKKNFLIQKGQAWKVVLNEKMKVIDLQHPMAP